MGYRLLTQDLKTRKEVQLVTSRVTEGPRPGKE
jgi:hypothetical protein